MIRINGKFELTECADLDTVHLLDILDFVNGIYTFGGSLTELSLMMAATNITALTTNSTLT